jgi:predicted S18 family serine protease
MLNLNKQDLMAMKSIAVLFVIILVIMTFTQTSMYQPRPIKINPVSEKSIFNLESKIECTPGRKEGSAYTKSLTPGGLCGAQELVADHAGYEISEGIGGSLI